MTVWLAQCKCRNDHAILAASGEAENADEAQDIVRELRQAIAKFLASEGANPWCGICHAPAGDWRYEVRPTQFKTVEDAMPGGLVGVGVVRQNRQEVGVEEIARTTRAVSPERRSIDPLVADDP